MAKYFLGLDLSTQSITATIIDFDTKNTVYEESINFEKALGEKYNIKSGVVEDKKLNTVYSYPKMWVEAIDLIFTKMKNDNAPLSDILAISGSAQQHATVYVNNNFFAYLENLETEKKLIDNIDKIFSRNISPVWMDSSTTKECNEIRDSIGGTYEAAKLTGSDIFERFSGPQIRKFCKEDINAYNNTTCIHLASSFIASIIIGKNAPLDYGDASGMSLMDIKHCNWSDKYTDSTAINLKNKLPELVSSDTCLGSVSKYFVKNYGLHKNAKVIAFSGDNPNALIGVGLIKEGQAAYSLGTSDVYMSVMDKFNVSKDALGHIFRSPMNNYMTLLVFKNGSLAREKVRDEYNLDWKSFSEALKDTKAGNDFSIMLPYYYSEIIPQVINNKVVRIDLDKNDVKKNVRALIEGQCLSSRIHKEWIGVNTDTIYATGGASKDREILKVMANIHNASVYTFSSTNSASLGAAIRSVDGFYKSVGEKIDWSKAIEGFIKIDEKNKIEPDKSTKKIYDELTIKYKECENIFLQEK